jgi:hypothetical protein
MANSKIKTPTPVAASAAPAGGDTVFVAYNSPVGIKFPMPDGRKVLIEGNAAHLRGKEKGTLPIGGFGLTRIAKSDWAYIVKTYGGSIDFTSGRLFAQDSRARAEDEAGEKSATRHGLEPVDTSRTNTKPIKASELGF